MSDESIFFQIPFVELWNPNNPVLYNVSISLGKDTVYTYTGFRSIEKGVVGNAMRPLINGDFIFQWGTLDQGYWPDGMWRRSDFCGEDRETDCLTRNLYPAHGRGYAL